MTFFLKGITTVGFIGYAPRCPGTLGTLAAIPLFFLLYWLTLPIWWLYPLTVSVLMLVSVLIIEAFERREKSHDSSHIVLDEVIGFLIAMTFVPPTLLNICLAFGIFRFFDILKPFPISYVDQKMKNGLGTVLDDALAGMITNSILIFILPWVLL